MKTAFGHTWLVSSRGKRMPPKTKKIISKKATMVKTSE